MALLIARSAGDRPWRTADFGGIVPDRLRHLGAAEVAGQTIAVDGRACRLGDWCAISGDAADGSIECHGDFRAVDRLAAGMEGGTVVVHGPVGRHAGAAMAGGRLLVHGDAGDWLAAGMTGGEVIVTGDAGDLVGAAPPGTRDGMRGGRVLVGGNAGRLAASRLRRGVVAIGGTCGPGAAFELRAGTLLATRVTRDAGVGMARGSVVVLQPDNPEACPAPGFRRGACWQPPWLPLLAASLPPSWGWCARRLRSGVWRQWHGDPLGGARGELWLPARVDERPDDRRTQG
ncbi:MAG: formylmethanofuran dehydrogenase subunit C [Planctomycetaceae bacterium]